ncbi:hypothetical protein B0J14DRAFT_679087 [Halenospora varia]|nr:hypothetical protein B0J14DRAFT_679087 [Halenospora varia]
MASVKPTPYARKHNVLPEELDTWRLFHHQGKSSYTPTHPPTIIHTAAEIQLIDTIERYQKNTFFGFSARDLLDMGALSESEVMNRESLTNPILPFLQIKNWESRTNQMLVPRRFCPIEAVGDCYSVPEGHDGLWHAHNPVVWQILEPILRLATRIYICVLGKTFVEALVCGEYRDVPAHLDLRNNIERAYMGPLRYFFQRKPGEMDDEERLSRYRFLNRALEIKLQLGIGDGLCNCYDRETPTPNFRWSGATQGYYSKPDIDLGMLNGTPRVAELIDVQLAKGVLQPFLRNDLTTSERMVQRTFVAFILVHEIMHSTNIALMGHSQFPALVKSEPYFENDIASELGRAFEKHVVGGQLTSLSPVRNDNIINGSPLLGVTLMNYPNRFENVIVPSRPILGGLAAVDKHITYSPVMAEWMEAIHHDNFWNAGVAAVGISFLQPFKSATNICNYDETDKVRRPNALASWTEMPLDRDHFLGSLDRWEQRIKDGMGMMPRYRETYLVAKSLADVVRRTERQRAFRTERTLLAQEITNLLSRIREARAKGEEDLLSQLHATLLTRITRETEAQFHEVISLGRSGALHNPPPALHQHIRFLARLNRRLRKIAAQVMRYFQRTNQGNPLRESKILGLFLMELNRVIRNPPFNIDPKQHLSDALANARANPLLAADALYTNTDAREEEDDIAAAMSDAQRAQEGNIDDLARETGFELLCNLDHSDETTPRAKFGNLVGRMLISRIVPVEQKKEETKDIAMGMFELNKEGVPGVGGLSGGGDERERAERDRDVFGYWFGVCGELVERELGVEARRAVERATVAIGRNRGNEEAGAGGEGGDAMEGILRGRGLGREGVGPCCSTGY